MTNPRTDKDVRREIGFLADLTEYEEFDTDGEGVEPLLGNLIETGETYLVEHVERLEALVHERLVQLDAWWSCAVGAGAGAGAGPMDEVKQSLWCVGLLCERGW